MSKKPRKLLAAWTADKYEPPYPPFVNATQVGSMVELIVRNEKGECVQMTINAWTLEKFAETLKKASRNYDTSMPEFEDEGP